MRISSSEVLIVLDRSRARNQLDHSPLDVIGVGLDACGISVDALRRCAARAAIVTPAHQAPTGIVMTPGRRDELLRWARDVDGYVVEDDYDAEFRYDQKPVRAMQPHDPDRVVYCGTTSKTVAPALRLSWLVAPPHLVDDFIAVRRGTDVFTSSVLQATFAAFMSNGDLDRHLRRVRSVYRRRRQALVDAVDRWFPEAVPTGISAGVQTVLELPPGSDETAVAERALAAGVRVNMLAQFRIDPRNQCAPSLLLGYGSVKSDQIDRGVRLLADAYRSTTANWSG